MNVTRGPCSVTCEEPVRIALDVEEVVEVEDWSPTPPLPVFCAKSAESFENSRLRICRGAKEFIRVSKQRKMRAEVEVVKDSEVPRSRCSLGTWMLRGIAG